MREGIRNLVTGDWRGKATAGAIRMRVASTRATFLLKQAHRPALHPGEAIAGSREVSPGREGFLRATLARRPRRPPRAHHARRPQWTQREDRRRQAMEAGARTA